jgi:hypothetical protein
MLGQADDAIVGRMADDQNSITSCRLQCALNLSILWPRAGSSCTAENGTQFLFASEADDCLAPCPSPALNAPTCAQGCAEDAACISYVHSADSCWRWAAAVHVCAGFSHPQVP